MGYKAFGGGEIIFSGMVTDEQCRAIEALLAKVYDEVHHDTLDIDEEKRLRISVYDNGEFNYHEFDVTDALHALAETSPVPIISGEIRYSGEDDDFWRFRFVDGNWKEENGHIVYQDTKYVLVESDGFTTNYLIYGDLETAQAEMKACYHKSLPEEFDDEFYEEESGCYDMTATLYLNGETVIRWDIIPVPM